MAEKFFKNIEPSTIHDFANLVTLSEGIVESRGFINRNDIKMTMLALPKDEGINAYALPGDTLIVVLEGEIEVVLDDQKSILNVGESLVVTAGVPHGINPIVGSKVFMIEVKIQ